MCAQVSFSLSFLKRSVRNVKGYLEWLKNKRYFCSEASGAGFLDAEWFELAKKQLKGKDPSQTLTWNTPE
uniref:Uncharacterized protein n=1 Tax=Amphimedon queenslandica TaxID=400682 RepID=A0A1X7T0Q4_AMPQE